MNLKLTIISNQGNDNLVFFQVGVVQGPGRIANDLVDVPAVADAVVSLLLGHDGLALVRAS